jgi:hypothetical protein
MKVEAEHKSSVMGSHKFRAFVLKKERWIPVYI